ncbi:lysophospholipid acyltransferase family protein [Jiangella rhizosphaerae]|uniref:1-acyl-sn-glycerol-3-phosphate acyltransferase n=1 Tax=Jiangella rhizosphaerae TaxID=2293569 RepID=A0A418KY03_9ACTN|nr:lysophospholipid acyltransferase family protein [Jiangella rhizosphaerae]RIQ36965.1 1-acyl-sn-glycerol-3-phosphate acyltransferase [Jiangella rhizosphaerae]
MSELPSTKRYHAAWHRWARFVAQRLLLRPVVHLTTKVTVRGAENLDGLAVPFIVVANHSSHLDAPLLVTELPRRYTRTMAVNAAADYFYRWWWMKATTSVFFNTYPVSRTNADMGKGRGLANRLLSENVPVVVFPEGTRRNTEGGVKRFKPGAAALSIAQGVPCVPVAIIGTDHAMPVGRWWPKPGRPPVTLVIGAPIRPLAGERTRELTERLEAKVAAMVATGDPGAEGKPLRDATEPDEPAEQASDHAQKEEAS